ncbi:hypothetical protein EMGBS4_18240 [Acidimicrobiaceae bacterium]|nr:hypothetical protein EMGBS4_18240 [Acidimicrobiaceae bacterium]
MSQIERRVTRDELQNQLTLFQEDIQSKVADKSEQIRLIKIGSAIVALFVAFMFGRRSGKKNRSIIEIFSDK